MTPYQILSLCGIPSLIASIIVFAVNSIKNKSKEQKAMHEGIVAILHNMVYRQGTDYIHEGKITFDDMEDYEYLYKAYHELGGNGTGTEIYKRVKKLEIKEGDL